MIERVPIKENPQLFDKVIANIQMGLAANLPWLDHSFGRAERLLKIINGKRYYSPNIYIGNNEYELIAPDSGFGNYSFFVLDDPQDVSWVVGETSKFKVPFSVIFWVDMRTIDNVDERNTEYVKQQITRILNGGLWLRHGSIKIEEIFERAENVFKGFTLDEVDNQFMMHPYCGWRFSGTMSVSDNCIAEYLRVLDGDVYTIDNQRIQLDGSGYQLDITGQELQSRIDAIPNIEALVANLNKELSMFCVEPVTVIVGEERYECPANQMATIYVGDNEFQIIPTSNKSIKSLTNYPIPLTWYDWLDGVDLFSNIIFDMNELDTYKHWIQYYQGEFHVQKAQYSNCIFWSDKPYTHSPFEERTNYTMYYSAELPLCYSQIPENTYKPFYLAYGVKTDPNWNNIDYVNSYSIVSGATQTFSYYGAPTVGIFDMGVDLIKLPKDCRGLMYHAPALVHAGIFDAINTTNFGAKKGSWQEAFGECISLTSLYIKNLKKSINVSWSPINDLSISYIVRNAANTSKITISVSPYTWYRLSQQIKDDAAAKNIVIELITTNMPQDSRLLNIYTKPTGGIPATDLSNEVQSALTKAAESVSAATVQEMINQALSNNVNN